jgi:hypothetical protein
MAQVWHLCQEGCPKTLAHFRKAASAWTLTPVPEEMAPPSVGQQLDAALRRTKVSARELARRLAENDGGDAEDRRRWVQKVLADEIKRPNMAAVEKALALEAGAFALRRPQDEVASRRSLMRRVEALEADGDDLRRALTDARRAHEALRERVATLEAAARPASGRRRASG